MMLKTALLGTDSSNSSDLSKYSPSPNAHKIRHKIILTEALLMSADVSDNSLVGRFPKEADFCQPKGMEKYCSSHYS